MLFVRRVQDAVPVTPNDKGPVRLQALVELGKEPRTIGRLHRSVDTDKAQTVVVYVPVPGYHPSIPVGCGREADDLVPKVEASCQDGGPPTCVGRSAVCQVGLELRPRAQGSLQRRGEGLRSGTVCLLKEYEGGVVCDTVEVSRQLFCFLRRPQTLNVHGLRVGGAAGGVMFVRRPPPG